MARQILAMRKYSGFVVDGGLEAMAAISAHALIFRLPSSSICRPLFSSSSSSHCLPSSSSNTSGRLSFSTHEKKRSSVIAMGSSSSSLSGFDDRIGEILADVSIFTASTGESIMFKDLWDQKEVQHNFFLFFFFLGITVD